MTLYLARAARAALLERPVILVLGGTLAPLQRERSYEYTPFFLTST